MSAKEKLANRHLTATAKATHGRTDVAAQEEARNSRIHLRNFLSADPEALELARDGVDAFVLRTAQRIMAAHSGDLHINRWPDAAR
jgi:CBS-domain-containing membrane protein